MTMTTMASKRQRRRDGERVEQFAEERWRVLVMNVVATGAYPPLEGEVATAKRSGVG